MSHINADNFLHKHVMGRFPKWEPQDTEMQDWLFYIRGMDEGVALKAIREHKAESRYNTPALSVFREKARKFMPPEEKAHRPGDTVFVFYEGGGHGTLQPGYYYPIIVRPHEQHLIMKAAEAGRKYHEERYGGSWKVYSETTSQAMINMRTELRAAIADRKE